jgi:tetratricopeptide (TPR) repeat protein
VADNAAAFSPSLLTRTLTFHYTAARHALVLVWPQHLACDWSAGAIPLVEGWTDTRLFLPLAVYAGLAFLFWWRLWRERPGSEAASAACLCLVLPFVPASNLLVHVGFVVAERVVYLPALGFCLGLALLLQRLTSSRLRTVLLVLLVTGYTARTATRNHDWRTTTALFRANMRVAPHNAKIAESTAKLLVLPANLPLSAADLALAESFAVVGATAFAPRVFPDGLTNVGVYCFEQRNYACASRLLKLAVDVRPASALSAVELGNLAGALLEQKLYAEAGVYLKRALTLAPTNPRWSCELERACCVALCYVSQVTVCCKVLGVVGAAGRRAERRGQQKLCCQVWWFFLFVLSFFPGAQATRLIGEFSYANDAFAALAPLTNGTDADSCYNLAILLEAFGKPMEAATILDATLSVNSTQ